MSALSETPKSEEEEKIKVKLGSPNHVLECSVEKPLTKGVEPTSDFKVIHDYESSAQKKLSVFDDGLEEMCGSCALKFTDPRKLFEHLLTHQKEDLE